MPANLKKWYSDCQLLSLETVTQFYARLFSSQKLSLPGLLLLIKTMSKLFNFASLMVTYIYFRSKYLVWLVFGREDLEKLFSGMPAVFTGMLGGEELSQAYASGDVFVMPSESETLGLVVLEAMSSGLPVVAARAGGLIDIIPEDHEGKTGFCFSPGDIDDCVNKLKPLLHDIELRETIGKAAREEMEKYGWRAATRTIRNEQYNAAIWFWKKKRAQLLRPFQWLFKRIFQAPEVSC